MLKIGLTGGIASGKSSVSHYLQGLGAAVVDADEIAHALSAQGQPLWQKYVEHFGTQVLDAEGTLDRRAIGRIVFAQPDEKAWIDHIAHPLIQQEIECRTAAYQEKGCRVVFWDVPLLFEVGWDKLVNVVWLVYVRPEVQRFRLMQRNAYTDEEADNRIAAQLSLEEKRCRAGLILDNNGTLAETLQQVQTAWESLSVCQEG